MISLSFLSSWSVSMVFYHTSVLYFDITHWCQTKIRRLRLPVSRVKLAKMIYQDRSLHWNAQGSIRPNQYLALFQAPLTDARPSCNIWNPL